MLKNLQNFSLNLSPKTDTYDHVVLVSNTISIIKLMNNFIDTETMQEYKLNESN